MGKMRKGFYFTLDAIFACLLLVSAVVLYTNISSSSTERTSSISVSRDVLLSLGELRLSELNDSVIPDIINETVLTENDSVLYAIGVLWALNDSRYNALTHYASQALPPHMGLRFMIEGDIIYENLTSTTNNSLSVARQQMTGIAQDKPISGNSASANLKKIRNKRTSQFIYLGGFVGQGNLTFIGMALPTDANITAMYLELDIEDDAAFLINSQHCSDILAEAAGNSTIEYVDITSCAPSMNIGTQNTFELRFNNTVRDAYVTGGLLNVEYTTGQLLGNISLGKTRTYLPGINGLINLYDAIEVGGTLTSMKAYLHYVANHSAGAANNTFYFSVGNKTIFKDENSTIEQFITLTNVNFSSKMNYADLSNTTVPIRIGFENLSFLKTYSGNADIVFVTDVSGSMDREMDSDSGGGIVRACNDPNLYGGDTQRLSVAKCLEKEFIVNMLNYTNNWIGLVSYETGLDSTWPLETTYPPLETEINTYTPQSRTCICCGLNAAVNLLDLSTTPLIIKHDNWLYNSSYLDSVPPVDGMGREWYEINYDDSLWSTGQAILGSTSGEIYNPLVDTEIGAGLGGGSAFFPDLWDMASDLPSPVDFTSGLNSTANTFGAGSGNDGWDWARDLYGVGNTDMTQFRDPSGLSDGLTTDGSNRIQIIIGGSTSEIRDGGAWGIGFEINSTMYDMIANHGGNAFVSFNYEAFDREVATRETEESCWLKARFGNSTDMYYLGYDLDSGLGWGGHPSDPTNEILFDYDNNVNWDEDTDRGDFNMDGDDDYNAGTYRQNVTQYISGNGTYYLELGAKFDATAGSQGNGEGIVAYYDNVQIEITNSSESYYFRKHVNIANLDNVPQAFINVLSDDNTDIYVNGQLVDANTGENTAEYWNVRGINLIQDYFQVGDNVIAAHLRNSQGAAKFDLELVAVNDSQHQAIFLMTDGQANEDCGSGNAIQDAINASCMAKQLYGITTYAVGFSDEADEDTLKKIAACGGGLYRKSDNATELQDFYDDVAYDILISSRQSQIVDFSEEAFSDSELYPDSYVEIEYNPVIADPGVGDISLNLQSPRFGACTSSLDLPSGVRIAEAKVTSYSAEHWTDLVIKDGQVVYNLSKWSTSYETLGDPFLVNMPANLFVPGVNQFRVEIGDAPDIRFNCSDNNTLLYTLLFSGATSRSDVVDKAEGCVWKVQSEDGSNSTFRVPDTYTGTKNCSYTSINYSLATGAYDPDDAYDIAVFNLLKQLDFDSDGRVFVNFDENDIEIYVNTVSKIPFLWGPSILEVQVWQ